jgi:uncharacterized protein (TIGR02271 family)
MATTHRTEGGRERKLASLSNYELENREQDIRGHQVLSSDGRVIGKIDDLLVDTEQECVYAARLEDNRLVNTDYLDIRKDGVFLLVDEAGIAHHSDVKAHDRNHDDLTTTSVPVVEERLKVGKRLNELGSVKVHKHVTSRPVEEDIELRKEQVHVDRHAVDSPRATDAKDAFKDETFEVTAESEEAVVDKKAYVTEEVELRKDVDVKHETVRDEVRKTDVDVERTGDVKGKAGTGDRGKTRH